MVVNLLSLLAILLAAFLVILVLYLLFPFARVARITPLGSRITIGFLWPKRGGYVLYDSLLPFFPSTRIGSVRGDAVYFGVLNNQHNLVEKVVGTVGTDGTIFHANGMIAGQCSDTSKRHFFVNDTAGTVVGRVDGSLRSNADLNVRAAAFSLLFDMESREEVPVFDVRVGLRDLMLPAALIYAILFPLISWGAMKISVDLYLLLALLVYPIILLVLYVIKYESTLRGEPITYLIQMIDRNLGLGWMNISIIICSVIALFFAPEHMPRMIPLFVVILVGFIFNLTCFTGHWHQNEPSETWSRNIPKTPPATTASDNSKLVSRRYSWKPVLKMMGVDGEDELELTFDSADYEGPLSTVRRLNPFTESIRSNEDLIKKAKEVLGGAKTGDNSEETALTKILNSGYQLCMQYGLADFELFDLVLGFIQLNIQYKSDDACDSIGRKAEYFRFAGETLYDSEGDCDCKAVLAYGLFKRLGVDVDLVLVKDGKSDTYNHAAVILKNKPDAPIKLPPDYKEFEPGKGFYCELTGEGFHPGEIPPGVDLDSLIRVPKS